MSGPYVRMTEAQLRRHEDPKGGYRINVLRLAGVGPDNAPMVTFFALSRDGGGQCALDEMDLRVFDEKDSAGVAVALVDDENLWRGPVPLTYHEWTQSD